MKKSTLVLAVAFALAMPSMALAAKKKAAAEPANLNANTQKLIYDVFITNPQQVAQGMSAKTVEPAKPGKKMKKGKKKG
jgi:hypothetical protein